MVGFGVDGGVRIWVNQNYASNNGDFSEKEQGLVDSVFAVFEQYVEASKGGRRRGMGLAEAVAWVKGKRVRNGQQQVGSNVLNFEARPTVKYVGVASPNLRNTAVNYIVVRNATKTVQIDLNEQQQKNNISGNSNKL